MKSPQSVEALETLGRVRLSKSFFMRDFLYSEIANHYGMRNVPANPDLAIEAGKHLCEELLEPLQATFGRIAIRSAYRSREVNDLGNAKDHNCGSSDSNRAAHIWDERDANGHMGAMACIVVPWLLDQRQPGDPRHAMDQAAELAQIALTRGMQYRARAQEEQALEKSVVKAVIERCRERQRGQLRE